MIKAVSFDIGQTLVSYKTPLNWKVLYDPALRMVSQTCGIGVSDEGLRAAAAVLTTYNTRENPRETEVTSGRIFREILDAWEYPHGLLDIARGAFYSFFQADAVCYSDVADTLGYLKSVGMKIGALSDVAYGMDNSFSLRDIAPIRSYFDLVLTSVDVGYRKPNAAGFSMLLTAFDCLPSEMMYVGDEGKDIAGANALGIVSVLVDRSNASPDWGQSHTIHSLFELPGLL